jgi:hypothetical protein
VFRTVDAVASTTLESYEHQQLLHRARRYIYIKGAVNAVIVLLFLLTFPPELKPRMVAIALADALLLVSLPVPGTAIPHFGYLPQPMHHRPGHLSRGLGRRLSNGCFWDSLCTTDFGRPSGSDQTPQYLFDIWPYHCHLRGHHRPGGERRNSRPLSSARL